jgi:inhibitor of KinA
MRYPVPKIYDLGDSAMTIEFGDEISIELNQTACTLADHLNVIPFPGLVEATPAYASTTVFYDPLEVAKQAGDVRSISGFVRHHLLSAFTDLEFDRSKASRLIEVPARLGGDDGPDLASICKETRISETEFIDIFTEREYRVFMLGFLPGFAYMGTVDDRIATTRRASPRQRVPAGSIGIADDQTGIYPLESPGGWQLIGRTEIGIFSADGAPPWAFSPGDRVRFVPS